MAPLAPHQIGPWHLDIANDKIWSRRDDSSFVEMTSINKNSPNYTIHSIMIFLLYTSQFNKRLIFDPYVSSEFHRLRYLAHV